MKTRNAKLFFALILLLAVARAKAAPTIADTDAKLVAHSVSQSCPADSHLADQVRLVNGTCDSALANIATDLLKPPADFKNLAVLPPGTKSLPAVPAALFMGLTGFMCVSLVRDRKVWLAGLTALLWIGQLSITTLPRFVSFVKREAYSVHCAANSEQRTAYTLYVIRNTQYELRTTNHKPQTTNITAINEVFSYLIPQAICLAEIARQITCFSPAFIFESIPRGPP